MPIYMDRHETKGATHENVATAHDRDLEVAHVYGVKPITYWFDAERGTAFCLLDAPNAQAVKDMHNAAHGKSPHEVIEVDPAAVQAFLGRISDPHSVAGDQSVQPIDSAFRAIMFTDIAGSTDMTSRLGDERSAELVQEHNKIIRDALKKCDGVEIKFTGDGFHVSFSSVVSAVRCAIEIQNAIREFSASNQNNPIKVKVGLSAGEPVAADKDLFGSTVNLAARLCDCAEPDEILVAQVVRDLCLGKGYKFSARGDMEFKGIPETISVFKVAW